MCMCDDNNDLLLITISLKLQISNVIVKSHRPRVAPFKDYEAHHYTPFASDGGGGVVLLSIA